MIGRWLQELDYIDVISNPLFQYVGIPLLIFLGFWLLESFIYRYILPILLRYTSKTTTKIDDKLILAFVRPIRLLILILGIYTALMYLPLSNNLDSIVSSFFRSLLIVILAWGASDIAGTDSVLSEKFKEKLQLDSILVVFFLNVVKFIILALAIVLIAHEWDYDVNGFIAGLGLGGLAFALAAKDALANIFGGIVIIMEKPFSIGDWVQTRDVEGTVEEISFRSTRFRTVTQALVTVPNSNLANNPITNLSRMGKRQIRFTLSIDYAGPRGRIEQCIQEIRDILKNNPAIHPQTILVYLENINVNSLDILVYFFTNTTNWEEHLAIKEDINYQIMDVLAEKNLAMASPGRVVYSENVGTITDK